MNIINIKPLLMGKNEAYKYGPLGRCHSPLIKLIPTKEFIVIDIKVMLAPQLLGLIFKSLFYKYFKYIFNYL